MNALEKAVALDMLSEADSLVFNEDEIDGTLDIWESTNEDDIEEEDNNG